MYFNYLMMVSMCIHAHHVPRRWFYIDKTQKKLIEQVHVYVEKKRRNDNYQPVNRLSSSSSSLTSDIVSNGKITFNDDKKVN